MRKASTKDILRTVWKEKKRFISIMTITVLGVTMMTGLEAGCRDLKISADQFYDSQELFDISIMSTLGLTEDDVWTIQTMEGIEKAEGTFSEIVHTKKGDVNKTAEVKVFRENGLNIPYVLEGRLPASAEEIAVSETYLKETGKVIGDKLTIEEIMGEDDSEEEETPNFPNTEFTIVGTIVDVMDINNADSAAAFRATPNADYTFFVTPEAVESEVYTAVYVTLEGTDDLLCYSEGYEEKVEEITNRIETEIMEQRELARHQQITEEAYEKIAEKEAEMYDTFADVEQEFADAWEEISDGWKELIDGKQELTEKEQEAKEEITEAKAELEDAYVQLNDAWVQLNDAEKQLNIGQAQLDEGMEELRQKEKEAKEQLEEAESLLKDKIGENDATLTQLNNSLEQMKALFGSAWEDPDVDSNVGNIVNGGAVSNYIEPAWNDYVAATTEVIIPVIAGQMKADVPMSESQMQGVINDKIMQEIARDPAVYGVVVSTLKTNITNTISGMQASILNGATAYDKIAELQSEILTLETNIAAEKTKDNPDVSQITMWEQTLAIKKGQLVVLSLQTDDLLSLATGIATCNATEIILDGAMTEFEAQKESALAQIEAAWAQLREAEQELKDGRAQLSGGRGQVIENYQKWQDGVKELNESEQEALLEIADAWEEIADGEQELIDGEQELEEHQIEYQEEREKAENKIAEAKQEVADIDMTKWYVQDRTSLSGYSNVKSDTACIESLSTVFTVVFFVVAILISLTTVTRMVEEERGLIGTYKALGFTDGEIRRKYVVYACGASILGALIGDIGGFIILPEILFIFFKVMYLFPAYILKFEVVSGTVSGIFFIVGIVGAAFIACHSELKHVPAHLMRPKAPKEGSRVFLEYIKPLWKRMSFLNKVTARNLFRYKKRMFMTLFGIMGCTALLVFGLAIKDSVAELMPLQYETVYKYDLLSATSPEDNDKLIQYMEESAEITEYLNIQVETVKLKNEVEDTEKVQLMILPDGADISKYLTLKNAEEEPIILGNDGIYLTENAAGILELKVGDTAYIQKLDLTQEKVQVAELVKNYLGNNIYMSQAAYETIFGVYEPNGILANLSESCSDQIAFSDKLAQEDWILSSVSTEDLKGSFSQAFILINIVVYVVLVLAACLAFVVLFTLASINISERERELATIKVLGFYDKEVHSYVNKETLILTTIGILIGLPVGTALSSMLTDILNMPSIYFAVTIYNKSYLIAAGLALVFAFIVQFLTDRSLDVIDPVEALKSVE